MKIAGVQKLTLIDFPGRMACTIFLCGCNFRCSWCYSRELVLPEEIKKHAQGHPISEKDLFKFLKDRKRFLEGMVICGGEPTIHKDLPIFIKKIKKLGYAIKLDTNGSNPQMLKNLIEKKLIDFVAMDVKAPIKNQEYNKVTGVRVNLNKIKKSIEIIKNSGIDYEFRTTIIPTLHTKKDIVQIAKAIFPAKRYFLQNFRPEKTINQKFEKIKPYSKEYLLEIQKAISPFFEICQIRY